MNGPDVNALMRILVRHNYLGAAANHSVMLSGGRADTWRAAPLPVHLPALDRQPWERMSSNASRFTYANSYAAARGFGAGFPNFHEADYGNGVVYGTYFLDPSAYDFRDVPVADYGVADRLDVPRMMRAANDYAAREGYGGAFPTFHIGSGTNGPVYGTILVKKTAMTFRDVPRTALGGISRINVGDMFRAAADYSSTQGFPAAFPTFHGMNHGNGEVYGINLLHPGTVMWRDVPRSELALFGRAPKRWAIVLCTFRDLAQSPRAVSLYEEFFTESGAGTLGAYDYWKDASYGGIDLAGSRVFGWFQLTHDRTEIMVPVDPADPEGPLKLPPENSYRRKVFDWGIEAARAGGDAVNDFEYKMVVCPFGGHGATGSKAVAVGSAPNDWEPGFVFHEMGHAFGLAHSVIPTRTVSCSPANDSRPGAYCDKWDIMSYANVHRTAEGGPGPNAVNRLKLDCLPDARVWNSVNGLRYNAEVVLAALGRPEVAAFLAARIEPNSPVRTIPTALGNSFLVEYREAGGWDGAIPQHAVFVHGVGVNGRSLLVEPSGRTAALVVGDSVKIPETHPTVTVRVDAIDPAAHTATVRIWDNWFPPQPLVRIVEIIANPPGPDVPGGERVVVQNFSAGAISMSGWDISDLAGHGSPFYDFTLPAGAQVLVWTKRGQNDASNIYMNREAAIWNNTGDTAIIRNGNRVEVCRYVYTRA